MNNKDTYIATGDLLARLPVFYQPWWLDTVCKKWDVALVKKNGRIIAAFPYQVEKKISVGIIRNPLLTPYLSPFIIDKDTGDEDQIIDQLLAQLPQKGFKVFTSLPDDAFYANNELEGFTKTARRTFYINLQESAETLFKNLAGKRRNDIRKAMEDLSIEERPLDTALFHSWQQQLFEKKNAKHPYSKPFIQKVNNAALKHSAVVCLNAMDREQNNLGIIWLLYDQHKMYYMLSAANPQKKHRGAIAFLIWHAILKAKAMSLDIFDFEGSQDKGIADFFRRFGGEEKAYYSFEQNDSALWKLKRKLLG